MKKEIRGIVRQNPQVLEECCIFSVRQEDGMYLIISTDRQAAKDHIFVEPGEEIHIQGSCVTDSEIKGVIITEQAEIKLKKAKE